MKNKCISLAAEAYRCLAYSIKNPKIQLENGMFILSVDVDVGNKELGIINEGKNDINVTSSSTEFLIGETEEKAIPLLVELLDNLEIPVTFAIRGQVAEVDGSILETILESNVKHDLGAHGYSHKQFDNLSYREAEEELRMINAGMKKFGITPKSFVYPRNVVAHLSLLWKYGYLCYRGNYYGMHIEKNGHLYNIYPSLFLGQSVGSFFAKKILNIAIAKRLPCHVWLHSWNFGKETRHIRRNINNILIPLLSHGKRKEKMGMLTFETMLSASEKIAKLDSRGT